MVGCRNLNLMADQTPSLTNNFQSLFRDAMEMINFGTKPEVLFGINILIFLYQQGVKLREMDGVDKIGIQEALDGIKRLIEANTMMEVEEKDLINFKLGLK